MIAKNGDSATTNGDYATKNGDSETTNGDYATKNGDSATKNGDSTTKNGDSATKNGDSAKLCLRLLTSTLRWTTRKNAVTNRRFAVHQHGMTFPFLSSHSNLI